MKLPHVPSTPIVSLYDELKKTKKLGGLSTAEKLARCEEYVKAPERVAAKFAESVERMAEFVPWHEPFYNRGQRHDETAGARPDASTTDTKSFAMRLRDRGTCRPVPNERRLLLEAENLDAPGVHAVDAGQLAFEYLDRELQATRVSKTIKRLGVTNVRLDLMLANANAQDRTAIVAELKRTKDADSAKPDAALSTDKDPFSALIQALACASQLANPAQYARLVAMGRSEGRAADLADVVPPTFDIYVMLHNRPNGTKQKDLLLETERLSALLLAQPAVARTIRRIACLISELVGDELVITAEYAYERPPHPAATIEATFAEDFRPSAQRLPDAAVLRRADGVLHASGWTVRWRWLDDGSLQYLASHRMTYTRWCVIRPDGTVEVRPVPGGMMVGSDDRAADEARYDEAWTEHEQAVARERMEVEPSAADLPEPAAANEVLFRLDGDDWQLMGLTPPTAAITGGTQLWVRPAVSSCATATTSSR